VEEFHALIVALPPDNMLTAYENGTGKGCTLRR